MAHLRFSRSQKAIAKPEAQRSSRPQTNIQPSPQNDYDLGNQPSIQRQPLFQGLSQEINSSSFPIQAKLMIGQEGDKYEQEADQIATAVVRQMNVSAIDSTGGGETVQGQDKDTPTPLLNMPRVQRQSSEVGGIASPNIEAAISQARGGGQPLPDNLRQRMQPLLGVDLSGVRVHTDTQAHRLSQSLQALAFTTGRDIFFRQGEFNPNNQVGQELLAHELTHVVQQGGAVVQGSNAKSGIETETSVPTVQMVRFGKKKKKDEELLVDEEGDTYAELNKEFKQIKENPYKQAPGQEGSGRGMHGLAGRFREGLTNPKDIISSGKNYTGKQKISSGYQGISTALNATVGNLQQTTTLSGIAGGFQEAYIGAPRREGKPMSTTRVVEQKVGDTLDVIGNFFGSVPVVGGILGGPISGAGAGLQAHAGGRTKKQALAIAGSSTAVGFVEGSIPGYGTYAGVVNQASAIKQLISAPDRDGDPNYLSNLERRLEELKQLLTKYQGHGKEVPRELHHEIDKLKRMIDKLKKEQKTADTTSQKRSLLSADWLDFD